MLTSILVLQATIAFIHLCIHLYKKSKVSPISIQPINQNIQPVPAPPMLLNNVAFNPQLVSKTIAIPIFANILFGICFIYLPSRFRFYFHNTTIMTYLVYSELMVPLMFCTLNSRLRKYACKLMSCSN